MLDTYMDDTSFGEEHENGAVISPLPTSSKPPTCSIQRRDSSEDGGTSYPVVTKHVSTSNDMLETSFEDNENNKQSENNSKIKELNEIHQATFNHGYLNHLGNEVPSFLQQLLLCPPNITPISTNDTIENSDEVDSSSSAGGQTNSIRSSTAGNPCGTGGTTRKRMRLKRHSTSMRVMMTVIGESLEEESRSCQPTRPSTASAATSTCTS
jgi:hypothetical protein